jgi:steroid 5-alpha reductase family enzyme
VSPPSALVLACWACAAIAASCWVLARATREDSWVDRLWSIAPPLYVGWFAISAGRLDPRLVLMTVLTATWGVRLTWNFARKGGYAPGGEDYRWAELRRRMPPAVFAAFELVFISVVQNVLLLLLALPAWAVAARGPSPLGALDAVATGAFLLLLAGETIADEQQWRFQRDKKARRSRGEAITDEFLTTGLFRYSRHPNFFCEQGMWWAFYLFGVAAGGPWLDVTLAGPVLLTALFQGSTGFTESLTLAKYPSYAEYQRRTSRLVPWWPRA